MTPPYDSIQDPTLYEDWQNTTQGLAANEKLFDAGVSPTKTVVYPELPSGTPPKPAFPKYAFGYTMLGPKPQFWFFLKLLDESQEQEFQQIHNAWVLNQPSTTNPADHEYIILDQPPTCGTQTTPKCPPDPLLGGAMRYLRDVLAGAGATTGSLDAAKAQVEAFLVEEIRNEIEKLGGTLLLTNPGLLEAMSCLRGLKVGHSLTLNAAALEEATLEIEKLLVGALKAEATKRLIGSTP